MDYTSLYNTEEISWACHIKSPQTFHLKFSHESKVKPHFPGVTSEENSGRRKGIRMSFNTYKTIPCCTHFFSLLKSLKMNLNSKKQTYHTWHLGRYILLTISEVRARS